MAWAYQDCSGPLDQSERLSEEIKELQARVTDLEKKLQEKIKELEANEVQFVDQKVKYKRLQDKVRLLKGDLAQFDADNRLLKSQLDEAKEEVGTVSIKAVSEYQSSTDMAALKQTIQDETYEEAAESFAYTTAIRHPEWDLSYLGDHLAAQFVEWRADAQANRSPVE